MTNSSASLLSNQLLEVLSLSHNATAIYTTQNIVIEWANDAMINFWGRDRSVIGKPLAEAVPELKGQPFIELLQNVLKTGVTNSGQSVPAELLIDGKLQTFYYDYEYRAIKNDSGEAYCILHTADDVTERVQNRIAVAEGRLREVALNDELASSNEALAAINEELTFTNQELNQSNNNLQKVNHSLAESENQLQFAISAAELGTWDLNPATNHFLGNDRLKSWFGLDPQDEIELSKATEVIAEYDRDRVIAAIKRAMEFSSGGNYDTEYTIIHPVTGIPRIVKAKGKALFNSYNEVVRFSGTLQDITQQKETERRKDDFISIASHELRTPITSLKASLQLLNRMKDNPSPAMLPRLIEQSDRSMQKISSLIDDLLNVSSMNEGHLQLNKTTFTVSELLNGCCDHVRVAGKHSLIFEGDKELKVFADEHRIDQVVVNLVNNAVKYAPSSKDIYLIARREGDMAKISVKDTGPGISPEKCARLFDRYYRADYSGLQFSGLGLGLYISSEIVKRHGGQIGVDSELGKGSTFWFTIPINAAVYSN